MCPRISSVSFDRISSWPSDFTLNPFDARVLMKIAWTRVHAINALAFIVLRSDACDAATSPAYVKLRGNLVPHGRKRRELQV